MPYRLATAVEPVARMAAQEHTLALAAICESACRQSAMAGALVAHGVHPLVADQVVRYWDSTGMTISPEVSGQIQPAIIRPEIAREVEQAAAAAAAAAATMAYRPELTARPEIAYRPDLAWRPEFYRPGGVSPIAAPFPTLSPLPGTAAIPPGFWGPMSTQMPSPLGGMDPFVIQ